MVTHTCGNFSCFCQTTCMNECTCSRVHLSNPWNNFPQADLINAKYISEPYEATRPEYHRIYMVRCWVILLTCSPLLNYAMISTEEEPKADSSLTDAKLGHLTRFRRKTEFWSTGTLFLYGRSKLQPARGFNSARPIPKYIRTDRDLTDQVKTDTLPTGTNSSTEVRGEYYPTSYSRYYNRAICA